MSLLDKISIPAEIEHALDKGTQLYISYSGGKDGDAMLDLLPMMAVASGWKKPIVVFCDLGRAEWYFARDYVSRRVSETGLELKIIARKQGDLQQRMEQNLERHPGGIPFPSAATRFCTSELKTEPTNILIRNEIGWNQSAIIAMGIRAEESSNRAKKPVSRLRPSVNCAGRTVFDWNPIFNFSLEDVWRAAGISMDYLAAAQAEAQLLKRQGFSLEEIVEALDWRRNPAYLIGNERFSCSICILASKGDILNGIEHNPEYYRALVAIERASGKLFRQGLSLESMRPDLLEE